ncbi:hypothetical protein D3C80_1989700 [compost metagenome]
MPGADQVIGRGLAGRVGRAGRIGRGFGEEVIHAVQVAVHLVGGNVMEAEGRLALGLQRHPIGADAFQQAVGADNVGLDEVGGAVDRAVHMGFGG